MRGSTARGTVESDERAHVQLHVRHGERDGENVLLGSLRGRALLL